MLAVQTLVVSGLAGCSSRANQPVALPSAPPSPAACGASIPGQETLAAPIVLLGETHGTTEIPAFFGQMACHAAEQRREQTILVGLEIPRSAQAAIDAFLGSDGGSQARKAVLEPKFWQREYQDGRSSKAMLDLLDELYRFRASGLKLVVRGIDLPEGESADQRDARMAEAIAGAVETVRPAQTLVLVGDVHSRMLKGYPWDPAADYLPMGAHMRAKYDEAIGLHVRSAGGTAWMCSMAAECGAHEFPSREITGETPRIALNPEALEKTGWSGTLFIGKITASPPARLEATAPVPGT